jgi:hypothetical protein
MPLSVARELLRFIAYRLEKQAALLSTLAASKTISEIIEAQTAFLDTALGDYGNEARVIVHRARRALP